MVWQPDVWAKALRSTRQTSYRMCRTKEECELVCKQQLGWRPWAYDLGRAPKASNHPKAFVAAPDDTFLVGRIVPVLHYCMGGLKVNEHAEARSPVALRAFGEQQQSRRQLQLLGIRTNAVAN